MLIPKQVMGVAKIASKDKDRPDIQCVLIDRDTEGRPGMFATDGARCIAVSWNELAPDNWPTGLVGQTIAVPKYEAKVVADDVIAAQSNVPTPVDDLPATGCALLDERGTDRARFFATDTLHHATHDAPNCADRIFPDLRSLLTKRREMGKKDVRVAVNAAKLADLLKVVSQAGGVDTVVIGISHDGDVSIKLDAWNNAQAIAVTALMAPMKLDDAEWTAYRDVMSQVIEPAFEFSGGTQQKIDGVAENKDLDVELKDEKGKTLFKGKSSDMKHEGKRLAKEFNSRRKVK